MRQLILDTETTGLYPEKGDRIIEFAALEMIDRKLTGNSLQLYINPNRPIDPQATKIHGITDEFVADKPTFDLVVEQIIAYIKGAQLIIHNAKFDLGFLDYQLKQHNLGTTADHVTSVIDTLIMSRQKFPGGKNSLDALCDRFNIDRAHRNYHGALIDCSLLAEVYLTLTKEQISLIKDDKVEKQHQKISYSKIETQSLNLKIIHPTQDELSLHENYLGLLHKNSHGESTWYNQMNNS